MFSKTYFVRILKENYKSFAVFTLVLCALITIIMSIFTPETMREIAGQSADLPFNPLGDVSTLPNFLANQYFGMMALLLPMIWLIMTGIKLIAGKVDNGEMSCELSTPVTRTQIAGTTAVYMIISLVIMYILIFLTGVSTAAVAQPGELDIKLFLSMTFGSFLLQFCIGSVVFLASCIFNRSSRSMIIGAGLPILFFAANMLSGMSGKLERFKYLSIITLFDTGAMIDGSSYAAGLVTLGVLASALLGAGIIIFRKKDLPL